MLLHAIIQYYIQRYDRISYPHTLYMICFLSFNLTTATYLYERILADQDLLKQYGYFDILSTYIDNVHSLVE